MNILFIFFNFWGVLGKRMLNPEVLKSHEDLLTLETYVQQGNSVPRDLPRTGSEANTTIFVYINILDIDSHCPYLLYGETTFHLTSC